MASSEKKKPKKTKIMNLRPVAVSKIEMINMSKILGFKRLITKFRTLIDRGTLKWYQVIGTEIEKRESEMMRKEKIAEKVAEVAEKVEELADHEEMLTGNNQGVKRASTLP